MKPLVAVFAHPDDEVFGPGGSIAKFAQERDVYLICVTNGDAGQNSSSKTKELAEIRREELQESIAILGIKKVYFLHYKDGDLSNNLYHEIAEKVQKIIEDLQPDTLLTYENKGVSGHLDHIAVSMIMTYVFARVDFVKELWYYCLSRKIAKSMMKNYFIYFPAGYRKSEISKTLDVSATWSTRVKAMHAHASQRHDFDRIIARYRNLPKEEHFIILKKK